jgi:PDZ domain-containing secreted protein|tara:strand:- start:10829 stop:11158 length:330 start_codon:yes stop_codon:yes gene_type:complete
MSQKTTGIIKKISQEQTFKNNFRKVQMIVEIDGKYPQPIQFDFVNDKIDLLQSYNVGDKVEVDYNLRGKEWNDKVINSLAVWKLSHYVPQEVSDQNPDRKQQETADLPF